MNDVSINRKKINKYLGENQRKVKDRAYTVEEIQKLLEFCDERTKVMILLMASTGMRIGALPSLKLSNLTKIEDLYKITVYEGSKDEYYTFCSYECATAIDNYLDYRKRYGDRLHPSSPLLREQFDVETLQRVNEPKFLTKAGLNTLLEQSLHRSGLRQRENELELSANKGRIRKSIPRAHGFRKFYMTMMVRAKVNAEAREILLGHSIGLSDSYYRPDASEILEEYLKAVDHLTIDPANRLKRQVQELTVKASEMDQLRNEIDQIKLLLGK